MIWTKKKKSNFDSTTYVFLQQAPTNKVLKDTILNWFIAKFSLMCRYNTEKTLLILILLVPFYTRVIRRSLLANNNNNNKNKCKNECKRCPLENLEN